MFHPNDWDVKTKEELESAFKGYCEWCWGHGFGNCDVCKAHMREYLDTLSERGAQDEPKEELFIQSSMQIPNQGDKNTQKL